MFITLKPISTKNISYIERFFTSKI